MNPLARLRQMRKAAQLYDSLMKGETAFLIEHFPFIEAAFTPKPAAPPPPSPVKKRKLTSTPKVTFRASSEEDDLRDALDIGFNQLNFDPLENEDR
jgi:hypothetical protein